MMSDFVERLLHARGITETEEKEKFLNPDFVRDTHDPFRMEGMEKAVNRILQAMDAGERIAVYADFDCDGIPGAALLSEALRKIGYTNIEVYIPHRDREGYGFHTAAIDVLHAHGVTLIITIDVGTVAVAGVAHANTYGIDVIVTDHHEVQEILPDAYAIVNPKLGDYPFKDLCGAATAWKLVVALVARGRDQKLPAFSVIPEGWEKWLLDLVALATVADLVPLVGENRALVSFGLTVLRKSPRLGIRALCTAARVRQQTLTEDDIAFTFAPRINAASRMDNPELALQLLTTHDADEAERIARELESLNRKRRSVVAAMVRDAKARARARFGPEDRVAVLGDVDWKPSLCGLAANSIMEERGGLVCMWGRDANGKLKGSCRSDGSFSVVELFQATKDVFLEFGGHHASGGFSISHDAVHTLQESLAEALQSLTARSSEADAQSHADIRLSDVSTTFLGELARLSPFGMGNPKPLFRVCRTRVTSARRFGKDMNHTELQLICSETGVRRRAFQFFRAPTDFTLEPRPDMAVDVLATVEKDAFRGADSVVLRVADVLVPRV